MPDYKMLYQTLLHAHGQAIDILTQAGLEAEEMLLDSKDSLELFNIPRGQDDDSGE